MAWIRPAFIDAMGWAMGEVYGAITDQILINLAHYFPYWKSGQPLPQSTFEYQAHMLAQMGQVNRDTIRIIAQGLGGRNTALTAILEQAVMEGVKKAQPDLLKGVMRGILQPAGVPVVDPSQTRAFQFYYNQAVQKTNLVNTVMLESTRQAYQATVADVVARVNATQSALNIGAGETITGVSSWNQAVKNSISKMTDNGITGFIDHAGHHWSAEAYVSMDIRTTVANTARSAVWETNQNMGNDLYIVSYHDGARPLCYPWQNKVISATDNARITYDLDGNEIEVIAQRDTSYGEAAGLFGINCKHYPSPFIPGVSVLYDGDNIKSEEQNDLIYAQTQQQRAMERKLREEKRDILTAKAMGATEEELAPLRERARQTSQDIDDFCDETGLPRRRNREGVYTTRSFPDPHTYDPALFETQQKDIIDKYFSGGGTQTPYTFGQMTPNAPITPPPAVPVANVAQQVTQQTAPVVQSEAGKSVATVTDFKELKTYMKETYDIDVTSGVKKLDFDLVRNAMTGFESVAKEYPEVGQTIQKIRVGGGGVMACNGDEITFKSVYYSVDTPNVLPDAIRDMVDAGWWCKNTSAASIGAHETAHGLEQVLIDISGKYPTQASRIHAWNESLEARSIVQEACEELMKTPDGSGLSAFEIIKKFSTGYGAKGGNAETMAEAFADVYANGENASPLSKLITGITRKRYLAYKGVTQ